MGWSPFRQTGLTFHNPNQSIKGYTLFTPIHAEDIYLIDMSGQIVKTWRFEDIEPGLPKLLPNGHLMLSGTDKETAARARQLEKEDYSDLELLALRLGGAYNSLREYDFEGNLLWSYRTATMHHDFHICDNGDILMPHWEVMPSEAAKKVQGGFKLQHHATFVPGGNIQVFDNCMHKALSGPTSQIVEINPQNNEIVWRYKPAVPEQFFSGHLGGAQRLPLGNVLICEGTSGRLFEVTRKGEIVWEWINPFVLGTPDGRQFTWIYRAYRYPMDYPGLQGKALHPDAYRALNMAHGLA